MGLPQSHNAEGCEHLVNREPSGQTWWAHLQSQSPPELQAPYPREVCSSTGHRAELQAEASWHCVTLHSTWTPGVLIPMSVNGRGGNKTDACPAVKIL